MTMILSLPSNAKACTAVTPDYLPEAPSIKGSLPRYCAQRKKSLSRLLKLVPIKFVWSCVSKTNTLEQGHSMSKEEQIPCPLHLPLVSLNHISFLCRSVTASTEFYVNVLGFQLVRRPSSFDFVGAWLLNYGVGIHLLQCKSVDDLPKKTEINPRDNHISFQCPDMFSVEKRLQEMGMTYKKRVVEDGGVYVDQLFFHDPDGYMIEICNCENLPVIPVQSTSSARSTSLPFSLPQSNPKLEPADNRSEIASVPLNIGTVQMDIAEQKKEIETDGPESRY